MTATEKAIEKSALSEDTDSPAVHRCPSASDGCGGRGRGGSSGRRITRTRS